MPHRIHQPTKEQVRAYMAAREAARRPPPAPEEIRRLLGWHLERAELDCALFGFSLIPTNYTHLAASMTLDWWAAWAVHGPFSLSHHALFAESQHFSNVKMSPLDQISIFRGMMLTLQAIQHFPSI